MSFVRAGRVLYQQKSQLLNRAARRLAVLLELVVLCCSMVSMSFLCYWRVLYLLKSQLFSRASRCLALLPEPMVLLLQC